MLNLAMLSALGRTHELKLTSTARSTTASPRRRSGEVFLQVAVYCGVPAAVESFRSAKRSVQGARRVKVAFIGLGLMGSLMTANLTQGRV